MLGRRRRKQFQRIFDQILYHCAELCGVAVVQDPVKEFIVRTRKCGTEKKRRRKTRKQWRTRKRTNRDTEKGDEKSGNTKEKLMKWDKKLEKSRDRRGGDKMEKRKKHWKRKGVDKMEKEQEKFQTKKTTGWNGKRPEKEEEEMRGIKNKTYCGWDERRAEECWPQAGRGVAVGTHHIRRHTHGHVLAGHLRGFLGHTEQGAANKQRAQHR
jgi:hypothetical protein